MPTGPATVFKMNRKISLLILGIMSAVLIIGCVIQYNDKDSDKEATRQIFAMDTLMQFTAYGRKSEEAVDAAVSEVLRLDALLSTGYDTSEISVVNTSGSGAVSEDTWTIISEALEIYDETGGLFDITIYPLMKLWGFYTQEYHVPSEEELEELMAYVDASRITMDEGNVILGQGQEIDLGGIAKGFTSARVMEIFREYKIKSGMVSLGGNIQALGVKPGGMPWRIGIRNPDTEAQGSGILAVINVDNKAVITSGGYERYFEEDGRTYIHILDPRTGRPSESGLSSVTIVSENGMLADALSTSLFIMGLEDASEYWREHSNEFDMMLVTDSGEIYITEGIEPIYETYGSDNGPVVIKVNSGL